MDNFKTMIIHLSTYKKSNTIQINRCSTYPTKWIDYLNNSKKLLRLYRYTKTRIYKTREKLKKQGCVIPFFQNKYEQKYNENLKEFTNIIKNTNFSVICYHATRLTKEEIYSIKKNGLCPFNKESLSKKINNLYYQKYINAQELHFLKAKNLLNYNLDRENQIHFLYGFIDLSLNKNDECDLFNFFNNYGGEIIYNVTEETKLGYKLKKISYPCIVIFEIKSTMLDLEDLGFQIFNKYNTRNLSKLYTSHFICNKTIDVLDVIQINENSKMFYL